MRSFLTSFFFFIASSAIAAPPVCDGVTDDTAAVLAAGIAATPLPAGVCRITSDIAIFADGSGYTGTLGDHHSGGISLIGQGPGKTTILADYNGSMNGGIIRTDQLAGATYSYSDGIVIRDLSITQASGRTGLNGISLTAAWYADIRRTRIYGLSGAGIVTPWRSDINPSLSDPYQCFSVDIEQNTIENNAGWGLNIGAGQSPGIYTLARNMIRANAGGGIRTTTGQSRIIGNAITNNGTFGGQGGLLYDTQEGPSFVAEILQNEFDNNFNWHVNLKRSRSVHFALNRFLSGTYASNTSMTLQSGSAFIRPFVQINLGSGSANEVYGCKFEQNYHRSVTGPSATTTTVYAYDASTGALNAAFPCQFLHNDFGPWPADGVTQNSSGMGKYLGPMPSAVIIDP